MHTLFRQAGIYPPGGQLYEPEDMNPLVYYKEAQDGQILEEGNQVVPQPWLRTPGSRAR